MSDIPPRMEVCPYCKKSFKRLKSHLPYCKMIGATIPADQKGCQSKPATPSHDNKRKEQLKDLIKAKETNLERESEEETTKLIRNKPKGTVKSLPLLGLKKANNKKTDKYNKNQIQLDPKMLKNIGPKITLQGETKAQFHASENTSPKRELAKDLPKSQDSRSNPSETGASLLLGPMEPSSSNQDRRYSSGLLRDIQTPSANLKLDKINLPRQELLVESLDVPIDYYSSPTNLNNTVGASLPSNERDPKARDHLSEVVSDVRNSKTQEENRESLILGPRVGPLGKIRVEESEEVVYGVRANGHHLGTEAHGSRGNAEKRLSVRETHDWPPRSHASQKNSGSANLLTEKKSQDNGPSLNLPTPRGTTRNELLSVSQSGNQSLTSLAIKFLPEEKAKACSHNHFAGVQTLMEGKEQAPLEPRSARQCQALHPGHQWPLNPTWHHTCKTPFTNRVDAVDRKAFPSSMGLEWFPELYPGYLGLGMLPGKPQYWNAVAQKPQLVSPKGESLSQGWTRYSSTFKGSAVGGITVLFTGYLVLCCSWSFRHLSKPFCIFSLNYRSCPLIGTSKGFSGWLFILQFCSAWHAPVNELLPGALGFLIRGFGYNGLYKLDSNLHSYSWCSISRCHWRSGCRVFYG
ncbi:uncharacterized protein C17orf80 homolog isoform X2 [Loxodonta africana]|uniref:uncharacterized protein C17orf80 homolog isoform X2 n=1 Tax=Loxodonta africana TaxID=9785 RepID=UPI0030D0D61D